MAIGEFIHCSNYLVRDESVKGSRFRRLFAIFSFNQWGSQGKDHVTFHVIGENGIACIPGKNAKIIPLKWYQKDVNRAAILGGIAGALLSLIVQAVMFYMKNVPPSPPAQ